MTAVQAVRNYIPGRERKWLLELRKENRWQQFSISDSSLKGKTKTKQKQTPNQSKKTPVREVSLNVFTFGSHCECSMFYSLRIAFSLEQAMGIRFFGDWASFCCVNKYSCLRKTPSKTSCPFCFGRGKTAYHKVFMYKYSRI